MGTISLCLGLEGSLNGCRSFEMSEELYRETFKLFIKSLYEWKDASVCVHFSGIILDWLKSRHGEFLDLVTELVLNKKLELLGGGFYEPVFPFLPQSCVDGQLEYLNDFISRNLGKRPRGCWLTGGAWDSSLISSLQSCGISYTFLDSSLVFSATSGAVDKCSPITTEDNGKPLVIFPVHTITGSDTIRTPEATVQYLLAHADDSGCKIVSFFIPAVMVPYFFKKNGTAKVSWIDRFLAEVHMHADTIKIVTPDTYLQNHSGFPRAYIPQGASSFVFSEFYGKNSRIIKDYQSLLSVKNWLSRYPEGADIYYKMNFVNALVAQIRGDKARKRIAREKMMQAQNCSCFWNVGFMGVSDRDVRDFAYKLLLKAEIVTHEVRDAAPSLSVFDYDADGLKEYICTYPDSSIYIHTLGGSIFEFDNLPACRNYVNTGTRRPDGSVDTYRHRMFVDHLVPIAEAAAIRKTGTPQNSIFPCAVYQEISCDRTKLELVLKAHGMYCGGSFEQPVSLKKKFIFRKEGVQVQYILKNESLFPLSALFLIELNLSLPGNLPEQQNVKIFSGNTMHLDVCSTSVYEDSEWIRIEDYCNNIKFQIESNENGRVLFRPLTAPSILGKVGFEQYEASQVFFAWDVAVAPNYEIEKTIFFKVEQEQTGDSMMQ